NEEEIDLNPMSVLVASEWLPQIGDANSFFIPQQLSDISRTSSTTSTDYCIEQDHNVQTI
ncbi:unnamed protein product, partial [Adineta steineri]